MRSKLTREASFDELLLKTIDEELTNALGPSSSRAVKFYVDSHIALREPDTYADSLRKLLGQAADVLLSRISTKICEIAGINKRDWLSFKECVKAVRAAFRENRQSKIAAD